MRVCSVDDCVGRHHAQGWCNKHYLRWRLTGSLTLRQPSVEDRLWNRLSKDPETGCWVHLNRPTGDGYPQLKVDHKPWSVHRLAWTLSYGPIPQGMRVCHHCDNPPCCNPDHLFLGTDGDNARDRNAKGRHRRVFGELNSRAKLTAAGVLAIRREYAPPAINQRTLARQYSVSRRTIADVLGRRTWQHLKDSA